MNLKNLRKDINNYGADFTNYENRHEVLPTPLHLPSFVFFMEV
ncbi:MAG TPA: hypothetical protein VN956_25615 [Pyrinomonadaceae bacterium]|nr:hypothetical protein [Pyrinomonadaceae bacterium]